MACRIDPAQIVSTPQRAFGIRDQVSKRVDDALLTKKNNVSEAYGEGRYPLGILLGERFSRICRGLHSQELQVDPLQELHRSHMQSPE
jgi:hypothetical protein